MDTVLIIKEEDIFWLKVSMDNWPVLSMKVYQGRQALTENFLAMARRKFVLIEGSARDVFKT